jgi:hypothetical protein
MTARRRTRPRRSGTENGRFKDKGAHGRKTQVLVTEDGHVSASPRKVAADLRALADRIPADRSPLARQRAADAVEAVAAALAADPTLAERQQGWLDVLSELLRRLTPLARQVSAAIESERLVAAGMSTAHLGRVNPLAAKELDAVSARCTELAAQVAAEAWPDWDSPGRWRELSARRMPGEHELAEIASRLRRAVAAALDLAHPDPEAIRLAALADQIAPRQKDDQPPQAPLSGMNPAGAAGPKPGNRPSPAR